MGKKISISRSILSNITSNHIKIKLADLLLQGEELCLL